MATRFPLVGIGASAGGLEALQSFVQAIPSQTGIAFVIVQHLAPDHPSIMDKLLNAHSRVPVRKIEDDLEIEPDMVFVIPPGPFLEISEGRFKLHKHAREEGIRTPIDRFFTSLAEGAGRDAFAVILSGTGSDGTLGVRAIKSAGGTTFAQESSSARFPGMPDSAAATGLVDFIMRPGDMPGRILDILDYRHRLENGGGNERREGEIADRLDEILAALDADGEAGFTDYKPPTLVRRIQRRLSLLRQTSIDHYIETLKTDKEERQALSQDFLIGVTEFFRDPEIGDLVRGMAIRKLVASEAEAFRIWVPGCSTGEEAYSLAIHFLEEMETQDRRRPVQIFGTDVDSNALRHARAGVFSKSALNQVNDTRLKRFFRSEGTGYHLVPAIREMCIFAPHNLLKDPPFSRLDMVSCRNVMIYLTGDAQKTVLPRFHYGLNPGGYLLLGPSETLGQHDDLFEPLDRKARIFRRNDEMGVRFTALDQPVLRTRATAQRRTRPGLHDVERDPSSNPVPLQHRVEQLFLQSQAAPFAVVDRNGRLVHLSEAMTAFVRPSSGAPETTVDAFLSRELRLPVQAVLSESRSSDTWKEVQNVVAEVDGQQRLFDVVATPVPDEQGLTMIVLHEVRQREGQEITTEANAAASASVIQRELTLANRRLEIMEREFENTTQEAQSANEELLSMNEELQSANEELETSREELQSINEELETINAELSENNRQLARANSDLKNILESTDIATLFLDSHLRVRLFTPPLIDLYGVRERDIGRDISDLAARVDYPQLAEDARSVMDTLQTLEREVRIPATEQIFVVRVRPYRTVDDRLDGCVITFFDATEIKRNEQQLEDNARVLRQQYAELETLYDSTPVGLALIDPELRWLRINKDQADMNGFPVEDHIGMKLEDLIPDIDGKVGVLLRQVLETGEAVLGVEIEGETPKEPGVTRYWVADYYPVKDRNKTFAVGACVREVTERKRLEREAEAAAAEVAESRAQLRRLFDSAPAFVAMHEGPDHVYTYSNPMHDRLTGQRDLVGKSIREAFPKLEGTGVIEAFDEVYRTGKPIDRSEFKATIGSSDGNSESIRYFSQVLQPWFADDGSVGGVMSFAYDVTEQRNARIELERSAEQLKESEARMARLFDQAPAIISIFEGPEQRFIYVNPKHDEAIGKTDLIGKPLREAMPELVGQGVIERFERVFDTGEPLLTGELAVQIRGDSGEVSYFQQIIQPWYDKDGSIGGTMSFNYDVTDLVQAREDLRTATNRLTSIQDSLVSFVGLLSPDGTLLEANSYALEAAGLTREDVIGQKFWDCYWWNYSEASQRKLKAWFEQAARGEHVRDECEVRVGDEAFVTIDFQLVPAFDENGKVIEIVPSGIDVTAWKQAEARKDTLLAELQHRVKNTLATVQSVARFTARHSDTKEGLVQSLMQRLAAISRTHDVLTRTDWGGQSIYHMIGNEAAPYVSDVGKQLQIEGPDIVIAAENALPLSLAFHELATNAAKYGALSSGGTVTVRVRSEDGSTLSSVEWLEAGGPPVEEPRETGFGSFLLQKILPEDLDAEVTIDYHPSGIICRINIFSDT